MTQPTRGPAWVTLALVGAAGFLAGVVLLVVVRGVVHDEVRTATVTRTVTLAPSDPLVPDVTGTPLDDAETTLDALGRHVDVDGGGLFGIGNRSNWVVAEQDPGPGAPLVAGSSIRLRVERR